MRTLLHTALVTAPNADVLSGTELEFAPGRGVYITRAASSVATATLAVSGNRSPVVSSARLIKLRASSETRAEDQPWTLAVAKGEKVTLALAGTTGTVYLETLYMGQ